MAKESKKKSDVVFQDHGAAIMVIAQTVWEIFDKQHVCLADRAMILGVLQSYIAQMVFQINQGIGK